MDLPLTPRAVVAGSCCGGLNLRLRGSCTRVLYAGLRAYFACKALVDRSLTFAAPRRLRILRADIRVVRLRYERQQDVVDDIWLRKEGARSTPVIRNPDYSIDTLGVYTPKTLRQLCRPVSMRLGTTPGPVLSLEGLAFALCTHSSDWLITLDGLFVKGKHSTQHCASMVTVAPPDLALFAFAVPLQIPPSNFALF